MIHKHFLCVREYIQYKYISGTNLFISPIFCIAHWFTYDTVRASYGLGSHLARELDSNTTLPFL